MKINVLLSDEQKAGAVDGLKEMLVAVFEATITGGVSNEQR